MLIFRFSTLMKGYRSSLLINYLLVLISTLFFVVTPLVIDLALKFIDEGKSDIAIWGIVMIMLSTFLGVIFNYLSAQFSLNHFSGVDAATQRESFTSLSNKNITFFEKYGAGEVFQKIDAFRRASYLILTDMIGSFVKLTAVIICFVIMAKQSVLLTISFFLALTVLLFIQAWLSSIVADAKENLMVAQADRLNALNSYLHNIEFIKVSRKHANHFDILSKVNTTYINKHSKLSYLSNIDNILSNSSIILLELLIIIIAFTLIEGGELSKKGLLTFFAYKAFLMTNMNDVLYFLSSLFSVGADNKAARTLVTDEDFITREKQCDREQGEVETLYVKEASYNLKNETLFSDISFETTRGKITVVSGPSGSGKSTLLTLLLGVKSLHRGNIYLNNNQQVCDGKGWRKNFSVCLQSDSLFSGTISENICINSDVNKNRLYEVCSNLGILDDILSKPQGFEHKVVGGNSGFSGGQEQRLLLARAIYQDAPILLLDEVTSQLDQKQEIQVIEYLKYLNKIVVMIAHREECLKAADEIVYISDKD